MQDRALGRPDGPWWGGVGPGRLALAGRTVTGSRWEQFSGIPGVV